MIIAAFLVLALITITIFEDSISIALVFSGLLVLLWQSLLRSQQLSKKVSLLETKLTKQQHRTTLLEIAIKEENKPATSTPTDLKKASAAKQSQSGTVDSIEKVGAPLQEKSTSASDNSVVEPASKDDKPVNQATTETLHTKNVQNNKPSTLTNETTSEETASKETTSIPPEPTRQTTAPKQQRTPAAPTLIEKLNAQIHLLINAAWTWVTTGNVFVRVGVIILFMGMTFLTRYAIGQNLIPIELRLGAVSAAAIGLLIWGWLQREKRSQFALVIQGGGVALLYLTIFASFSLYSVISSPIAFALLFITVCLAATLAVLQKAKSLAVFASIGGFLAPILTSTGSNNFVGLFSYYTILNIGIFAIAWFQSWRILNFIGFIFTFGVFTLWRATGYEAANFWQVEPFLIIFFLLYVAIGVLYAFKRSPSYKDYVDSSLIFGTPLLAFGLQSTIAARFDYGIAISAFALAGFYIALTQFLWSRHREQLRLLSETFLALGVIFATLAIPFAIDGTLTGATWAIEGAGILWLSIRQQHIYRRLFGIALILASGFMLAAELLFPLDQHDLSHANTLFLNSAFIGCIIIALSANTASWLLSRTYTGKRSIEAPLQWLLLAYGIVVLLLGFEYQIIRFNAYGEHGVSLALLGASCVLAYALAAKHLRWLVAYNVSASFMVAIALAAFSSYLHQYQLADNGGYIIWPVVVLSAFYSLYLGRDETHSTLAQASHLLMALILSGLLLWEGLWQLLLGYALLTILFQQLILRKQWFLLKIEALFFFPVLVATTLGAVLLDGNLYALSNIASSIQWPFAPGPFLWPFGFAVYFYCLYYNRQLGPFSTEALVYSGGALIAVILLWLGLWPLVLGSALLSILCIWLWEKLDWRAMRMMGLTLLPIVLTAIGLKLLFGDLDPVSLNNAQLSIALLKWQAPAFSDYLVWALAIAAMFWGFWRCDHRQHPAHPLLINGGILFIGLWLSWKVSWHILDYVPFMHGWHLAMLPLSTMATLGLLRRAQYWPFNIHAENLSKRLLPVLLAILATWSALQLFSAANSSPLPWLPLMNPVDIVQAIILFSILLWSSQLFTQYKWYANRVWKLSALAGFLFVWANVELLRAVHHWGQVPWELPTIVSRYSSQTVLSLFWALCGLAVTAYANRQGWRQCWLIGASLLGVVVLKLFVVDLAAQGTIERIISFTGVGLLLTLVGYFAPIPPKKEHKNIDKNESSDDENDHENKLQTS